jgi:deazaflavin-dependent oxidoreductase (nitroreductase family)
MAEDLFRRVFRVINRYFMVPAFRLGLGSLICNPVAGYIMVLKTVGRKSGKSRYTPVNYAILDGAVYCGAGFGVKAHWYRNLAANPVVEVILPGSAFAGRAEPVTEPDEALRALRAVLKNSGFAAFAFEGINPFTISDEALRSKLETMRLIRIRPTGIGSGPADPGGWLWVVMMGVQLAGLVALILGVRKRKV